MTGPATITALDEAGRATWHHAFSIRFSQISCLPCPSDDWTSNNQRAGRGRQSNLTSCLFHQILSNNLPSLSIRWLDQQQSPRWTRPGEQLDIMPFPSDSLKFLAFLVHQMTGPATISAPDEAGRATWHHAFSIRFSQKLLAFLVHQMTGPATISAPDEAGRATWHHAFSIRFSQKLLAFLVHQMTGPARISAPDEASRAIWHDAFSISQFPSNDMWGWGNQRENQSGLASRSNLLSRRDENFIFYMILQMLIIIKESKGTTTYCDLHGKLACFGKIAQGFCQPVFCLSFRWGSNSTDRTGDQNSNLTWWHSIAMLGQLELRVHHMWGMLILNDLGRKSVVFPVFQVDFGFGRVIYRYL